MTHPSDRLATFERYRARLFGIAYRMLGSVHDAEDVVQEAWLRWQDADAAEIRAAEGWLVAVATRLSIDRLRRMATEREAYVGNWLPEPIAATGAPPDRAAELASDLSMAFLVLLERLGPEERAAFLLREVFGAGYDEIARILERSEAACRQVVHRARERVRRDERRFDTPVDVKERLLDQFLAAIANEDREGLLAVLGDEVVFVADGGGKASAYPEIVTDPERLAQLLVGFERSGRVIAARRGLGAIEHRPTTINGEPAVLTLVGGRSVFTTSFAFDGDRISGVFRVLNPDKLRHVGAAPFVES
ncbi:MAG TPA: RNA polymerase sigma factor SigJ [Gemmatimonadaceae bacterium]|nr:RNA polymerase sigma factor SigJ [Gemmatimonadaceae bacterium]